MRDLRVRLGVILALALLPLLVFSIWRSHADYNRDKALLQSNSNLTARIALTEIDSSFEKTQAILRFTSTLLGGKKCQVNLQHLTNEYPKFQNLIMADKTGEFQCSAMPVRIPSIDKVDLFTELSENAPYHTAIYTLPDNLERPEKVIVTSYATFSNGEVEELFIAVEDVKDLQNLLQGSRIAENSEVAVFNSDGDVLAGDWGREHLREIVDSLPSKRLTERFEITDKKGRSLLVVPTPNNNIFLAVAADTDAVFSRKEFNSLVYAIIPVLAWLFGFIAIWLATDQLILIHLRRMRRATFQFANGNMKTRIGKLNRPPAAIHALGKNFDLMADRIVEREDMINDSLDEKETLLREIHHRVKNNLQIIISLLNMQERKLADKEGVASIVEIRSRINAIALVHRGLYESRDLRFVNMQTFLDRLLQELKVAMGLNERNITVTTKAECEPMEADTATPVALFIVEALTNAVKHGVSAGGHVNIDITQAADGVEVSVSDSGKSFSADNQAPSGMGTKLMKGFARQLSGTVAQSFGQDGFKITMKFLPRDNEAINLVKN